MNTKETAYKKLNGFETVENITFETFGHFDLEFRSYKTIEFKNCTFNDRVLFTNSSEKINLLSFEKCTFSDFFGIESIKQIQEIKIIDCTILKSMSIEDIGSDSLTIYNSKFNTLSIKDSTIDNIDVIDSNVLISFDLIKISSFYTSISNKFPNKNFGLIRINSPEIEDLEIDLLGQIAKLNLFGFKKAQIYSYIEEINLHTGGFEQLSIGITSHEELQNSRVGKLSIINLKQLGNIRIQEVFIRELILLDVDATVGNYFLSEVVIQNTTIDGCIFSKFYCNQLFFIANPDIIRSDVSNFIINNLDWKNGKKLKESKDFENIPILYRFRKKEMKRKEFEYDLDEIVSLRYQKDTYRQLKKASLSNNNLIDALQFHSNEMQTYWKEIRLIGGNNFGDTILIFLNRWSSNFGQSWILPLIWLFLFHSLFFLFIMKFLWNNSFLGNFEFGQFWVMVNPIHKTPDYINSGAGLFTEFLMRIFNTYFIYHFVKATRKFGKI